VSVGHMTVAVLEAKNSFQTSSQDRTRRPKIGVILIYQADK